MSGKCYQRVESLSGEPPARGQGYQLLPIRNTCCKQKDLLGGKDLHGCENLQATSARTPSRPGADPQVTQIRRVRPF